MRYWINFNTNMKFQQGLRNHIDIITFNGNMPMLKSKNLQTKIIKIDYRSIRHTDYSHSKTETQKTPILCQSQFIKQWTRPTHWLVMIDTETTPILTQTHRLPQISHTDYFHSHTDTLPTPNQS